MYSYWDGSGHRRAIVVKKGATIGKFLEQAKQQLVSEFKELRSTSPEDLLYVKEDLIIPQVKQHGTLRPLSPPYALTCLFCVTAFVVLRLDYHESPGKIRPIVSFRCTRRRPVDQRCDSGEGRVAPG